MSATSKHLQLFGYRNQTKLTPILSDGYAYAFDRTIFFYVADSTMGPVGLEPTTARL